MQKAVIAMIKTWKNGAKGNDVRSIIDHNFNAVSKYLSKDIRALSTNERKMLSSDYISENSLVYDTDEQQWYRYADDSWTEMSFGDGAVEYKRYIYVDSWIDNTITILFEEHGIKKPIVQLYIKDGDVFIPVLGGIRVDSEYNVILSTDLPFDGKVIIK